MAITGDFALGGGVGGAVDIVYLNKGTDKGLYIYRAFDVNIGFNLGMGVSIGAIDFNPKIPTGDITRSSFEGWSAAASGGALIYSGTYLRAYSDGKIHLPGMPWNPPFLYSGVLVGLAKGEAGGMINWSNATLMGAFPDHK